MNCNRTDCYWQHDGLCMPECKEVYIYGRPNSRNCGFWMDKQHEQKLWDVYDKCFDILKEIGDKLNQRKYTQLKRCKWLLGECNKTI